MAVQTDLTTEYGVIPGAYIRVTLFSGDKISVKFEFAGYVSQASREAGSAPVLAGNYEIAFSVGNVLSACYAHLKVVYPSALDV